MTKQDFKLRVGQNKMFSCKWINNKGEVSVIKRGILGTNAWRHTNQATKTSVNEHEQYVLVYRIGNGLMPEHRRWANVNPETVFEVNGCNINEHEIHA
jgi:hypothetical protein|tara:strand:+ start:90 stop:383 length:294 start_codon:yes stop_codon:yes gene_type:complete